MSRRALTLLELIVVLSIIAVLLALLFPAIQYARESARRATCVSNLKQIMTALQCYEGTNRCFPPSPSWGSYGVHSAILPYIEMQPVYDLIDPNVMVDQAGPEIRGQRIEIYICPSDGSSGTFPHAAPTNYAGNGGSGVQIFGYNGLFRPIESPWKKYESGPVRAAEVSDGLSNTAAFAEILVGDNSQHRLRTNWKTHTPLTAPSELEDFANACRSGAYVPGFPNGNYTRRGRVWADGNLSRTLYNHILPPNCPSCTNAGDVQHGAYTAASAHSRGVQVAYADGHVVFVSEFIDVAVWRSAGSRNGNE